MKRNGYGNVICGDEHDGYLCSLSSKHKGDTHKAYTDHRNDLRTQFVKEWPGDYRNKVSDEELAEVMASLGVVAQPVQVDPPPIVKAPLGDLTTGDLKTRIAAVVEELTAIQKML